MRKQITVIIIATILTCAILISCSFAIPAGAEAEDHSEFYPRLTVVIEKEQIANTGLWVIYCQDKGGNVWAFYDDEGEWNVGDIANLLMWNLNETEEEDEIIEVYWEGYTENVKTFFQAMNWC